MSLGISAVFSFPPPRWGYPLTFAGIVLALRGFFPGLFVIHTDRQIIAGIEPKDEESAKRWTVALMMIITLAPIAWKITMQIPQPLSLKCRMEGVPVVNLPPTPEVVLIDPSFTFGSING